MFKSLVIGGHKPLWPYDAGIRKIARVVKNLLLYY